MVRNAVQKNIIMKLIITVEYGASVMNQQHNYSAKTRKENHMEEDTIVENLKSPNP